MSHRPAPNSTGLLKRIIANRKRDPWSKELKRDSKTYREMIAEVELNLQDPNFYYNLIYPQLAILTGTELT